MMIYYEVIVLKFFRYKFVILYLPAFWAFFFIGNIYSKAQTLNDNIKTNSTLSLVLVGYKAEHKQLLQRIETVLIPTELYVEFHNESKLQRPDILDDNKYFLQNSVALAWIEFKKESARIYIADKDRSHFVLRNVKLFNNNLELNEEQIAQALKTALQVITDATEKSLTRNEIIKILNDESDQAKMVPVKNENQSEPLLVPPEDSTTTNPNFAIAAFYEVRKFGKAGSYPGPYFHGVGVRNTLRFNNIKLKPQIWFAAQYEISTDVQGKGEENSHYLYFHAPGIRFGGGIAFASSTNFELRLSTSIGFDWLAAQLKQSENMTTIPKNLTLTTLRATVAWRYVFNQLFGIMISIFADYCDKNTSVIIDSPTFPDVIYET
ncbi:MAG: hypothetical protein JW841_05545 [Deltaproteobacteria bacterium]|nr:hypothetical protein [Deltaproteobacteria bacterium]